MAYGGKRQGAGRPKGETKGETRIKKRNWAGIIYEESAPENWQDILREKGIACAISPVHDMDIDPTGEKKKKHQHFILSYGSPTTYNNVCALVCGILGQPIPISLESVNGYYRYLTHKDNPDKYQYDEAQIVTLNGFNIEDFTELTDREIHELKIKIQRLILEKGIIEYSELMDFLLFNDMRVEHNTASKNTIYFNNYLKSKRHAGKTEKVDPNTGEVIEDVIDDNE
jgi:hypothetical protein